jgi:hypothetical protein
MFYGFVILLSSALLSKFIISVQTQNLLITPIQVGDAIKSQRTRETGRAVLLTAYGLVFARESRYVLMCWCVGVLVCWCVSVLVCWCVGVLVCWCDGVLVC